MSKQTKGGTTKSPLTLVVNVNPVPGSRPRVSRWGTYYPKRHKNYVKASSDQIPAYAEGAEPFPPGMPLSVDLTFVIEKPRTSKLTIPVGDLDNYAKIILDVITAQGYWGDDKQIVELHTYKRFASKGEQPHTRIDIKETWLTSSP